MLLIPSLKDSLGRHGLPAGISYTMPGATYNSRNLLSNVAQYLVSASPIPSRPKLTIRGQNPGGYSSECSMAISSTLGNLGINASHNGTSYSAKTTFCGSPTTYLSFNGTDTGSATPMIQIDIIQAILDGVMTAPLTISVVGGWWYNFAPAPTGTFNYYWAVSNNQSGGSFVKSSGTNFGTCPSFASPDATLVCGLGCEYTG